MNPEKPPIPVAILLFIGITAISFSSIFVKWSDAPVSIQAMYRLILTMLFMLPFGIKYISQARKLKGTDILKLMASGMMLAVHFLLWMGSLQWTSVASSTIILALQPVFVMIGAYVFFKERTSVSALSGMGIAFLGVFLLIGKSGMSGTGSHLTGDLMSLFGTGAIAAHMLLGQMLLKRIPSFLYSWFVFVFAALFLAGYNVFSGIPLTGYAAKEWGIFALLAVVPTVFGHLLFNWLMRYSSASTVSMSVLGEPVGASLLAFLLLNESMNGLQAAGGALVLLGLILFLNVRPSKKATAVAPTDLQTESLG
ncbi:Permease of the drug/metabolite transporter (DMT) superfamily [Paenibacillus uliginis N3/975]|uniref:Permease of the drug/metabolite transporter (DMT) superfamily n=1 Tax=Paenibacillus uliginis N3/975 TaxID=1313296 RepID=A0A1X7HHY5_9BACL|nr:DMT family transporter [Paenibacillus uliginis]SMF86078.1 Permease of the drug/metabolite transporter (DMT) superfamily [Paenibacillus uliginis N3/975]